jgi:hypothetical protein
MSAIYRKRKNKEFYSKTWIVNKLNRLIKKQDDKRFYLFEKVLTTEAVTRCLDKKPKNLYPLEKKARLFAQDGNTDLQKVLRSEIIQFGYKESESDRQEMIYPEFLLKVASSLGLKDVHLAQKDKLIQHGINLEVFL